MEKGFVFVLMFVFAIGLVCAADEWGSFDGGENLSEDGVSGAEDSPQVEPEPISSDLPEVDSVAENSVKYTQDFYIALGLGGVVVLIVLLAAYLFLRGPKNRWEK